MLICVVISLSFMPTVCMQICDDFSISYAQFLETECSVIAKAYAECA